MERFWEAICLQRMLQLCDKVHILPGESWRATSPLGVRTAMQEV
jgi:hypothetical protein